MKESTLFDLYTMQGGEDQFAGILAEGRPFSFCEVELAYYKHVRSSSRKGKTQQRRVQYFMLLELTMPHTLQGKTILYPHTKPFLEQESDRLSEVGVNAAIGAMNVALAALLSRKGSFDPFEGLSIKKRSLFHFYPPRGLSYYHLPGRQAAPFHICTDQVTEADRLLTSDLIIKLQAIQDKVGGEVFVSFFRDKLMLAIPGYLGNETSSFMDFDSRGRKITQFETYRKFYNELALYSGIIQILAAS